jgi:hypothetical protein
LEISAHTVEGHRQDIVEKLDPDNLAKPIQYAFRKGLLDKDTDQQAEVLPSRTRQPTANSFPPLTVLWRSSAQEELPRRDLRS